MFVNYKNLKLAFLSVSITFFAVFFTINANSETCRMVGGCVGNVWYIHVPTSQLKSSKIFSKVGLPQVNSTETITQDTSLLDSYTFQLPNEKLRLDLINIENQDEVLTSWGSVLEAGSKVRILSYQTFPFLGDMGGELFALVLVVSN